MSDLGLLSFYLGIEVYQGDSEITLNGGKFMAAEFTSYYVDEGVHRHYSTSYSSQ
jgi:hypothetical protein